jgi:hypothetical protein
MSKIFRPSSCPKTRTELIVQWHCKDTLSLITLTRPSRATGHLETAILMVSRLVSDLKPGVSDAPLRGYGA